MTIINTYCESTFAHDLSEHWDFSYKASKILFNYLEEFNTEYDPVAFRCNYNEYTIEEYINDYWYLHEEEVKEILIDNPEETEEEIYFNIVIENEGFIWGESDCFIMLNN